MLESRWQFPKSPTPRLLFYPQMGEENGHASILSNRGDLGLIANALNHMGAPRGSMGIVVRLAVRRKKKIGASKDGPVFTKTTHYFRGEQWTCMRAAAGAAEEMKAALISKEAYEKYGDVHIAVAFAPTRCYAELAEAGSDACIAPVARFADLADYAFEGPRGEAWAKACLSPQVRGSVWFESPKCSRLERALVPIWMAPMLLHCWGRSEALDQLCTQIDAQLLIRCDLFPQYVDSMSIYRKRPAPVVVHWLVRRHLNRSRKAYNKKRDK